MGCQNSNKVTDNGCTLGSAIEALKEFGACIEDTWPYDIACKNLRPKEPCYTEALNHKIVEAIPVPNDLNEMKACLALGYPFAIGVRLFGSFDRAATTGVVPMPNRQDVARPSYGRFVQSPVCSAR